MEIADSNLVDGKGVILRKSVIGVIPEEAIWRKNKLGFNPPESSWFNEISNDMLSKIGPSSFLSCCNLSRRANFRRL